MNIFRTYRFRMYSTKEQSIQKIKHWVLLDMFTITFYMGRKKNIK